MEQQQKSSILSTQGYPGTRDFYPEDMRIKNYIYASLRQTLFSFAYEEYNGPILEYLELYASKTSEEIVREQLYSFIDRGERKVAIRPEMTPTLARMVASKHREFIRPIRWFSIPTCMRNEKPQRGRLREFDQLNVDIFGGDPFDEDIEIILTAINLLTNLGAQTKDFVIRVNHRGIFDCFFDQVLALTKDKKNILMRLIDKKDKMSVEEFNSEMSKVGLSQENIQKVEQFFSSTLAELLELFSSNKESDAQVITCITETKEKIDILNSLTNSTCVLFDATVMRGFDYYTGLVFEAFDTHPDNKRAMFGGGRYDDLVGAFGADPLPGIGYGLGDVTLTNFLQAHNLLPELFKPVDVCVIRFDSVKDRVMTLDLSIKLRQLGLKVDCVVTNSKFGKQINRAERVNCSAVVFRGADEIKNNTFCVKWLKTGVQNFYSYTEEGFLQFKENLGHI